MSRPPLHLLAAMPAGAILDKYAAERSLSEILHSGDSRHGEVLLSKLGTRALQKLARGAGAVDLRTLAAVVHDSEFLSWLYETDKRVTVKLAAVHSRSCPADKAVDFVNQRLEIGEWKEAAEVLRRRGARAIVEGFAQSERFRSGFADNLVWRSDISGVLAKHFAGVAPSTWADILGGDNYGARIVISILDSTPQQEFPGIGDLARQWPWQDLDDRQTARMRKSLANAVMRDSGCNQVALLRELRWSELAHELIKRRGDDLLASDILTADTPVHSPGKGLSTDDLMLMYVSGSPVLDRTTVEWVHSYCQRVGQVRLFAQLQGARVHDSGLDALEGFAAPAAGGQPATERWTQVLREMTALVILRGTPSQVARALCLVGDPEKLDVATWRLGSLPEDHVVATLVELSTRNPKASSWLIRVWGSKRGNLPPSVQSASVDLLTQFGAEQHDTPIQGAGQLAAAVQSRSSAAQLVACLEGNPASPGVVARAVANASYWSSAEGRSDKGSRLRKRALRALEESGQVAVQLPQTGSPSLFAALTFQEASWAVARLPQVAQALEHSALGYLKSPDKLPPCHLAVVDRVDVSWAIAGPGFLEAAMEFLATIAGEDPARWEIALTLLPDWNGSLRGLEVAVSSV